MTEALRFVVVLGAVVVFNRLAASRPDLISGATPETTQLLLTVLGAAIGYLAGGVVARVVDRGMKGAEDRLTRRHASEILAGTLGLLIGGVATALLSWPLFIIAADSNLAYPGAAFIAIIVMTFTTRVAVNKRMELFGVMGVTPSFETPTGGCLLDTSALIDGRVLALYRAGLLPTPLCVPSFIIWELQGIADSGEAGRRRRGQRGLDLLVSLREAGADVKVIDEDPAATTEPDTKLVVVAARRGLPVVTADSNLAKAAEIQGVKVLSLHALADLLKPPLNSGDRLSLTIVKPGREAGQGVGYLEDGTMVVVDGAMDRQGEEIDVEIRSVIQTSTGRMLFAEPKAADDADLRSAQ